MTMFSLLTSFAAEKGPVIHITPGGLKEVNGFTITNSILYGWICAVLIILILFVVSRLVRLRPRRGLVQFIEVGSDFITNLLESSFGSREKALYYAPFFVTIFFFVLFNNWLGLLPGVGDALTYNGTPVFRPFTADLNGTLAAALVTMVLVQYFAIRESGARRHIRHYFNGSLKNPMTIFLGVFEMFGELTRVFSLGLRLFLNVAIGEIVIAVFAYLGAFAAPITSLPFVILELFVGALQAYIFVMLAIMYLAVAVSHDHGDEHGDEAVEADIEESSPETGKPKMADVH
jgi:F-type H+-transporting ATPase subunit a